MIVHGVVHDVRADALVAARFMHSAHPASTAIRHGLVRQACKQTQHYMHAYAQELVVRLRWVMLICGQRLRCLL